MSVYLIKEKIELEESGKGTIWHEPGVCSSAHLTGKNKTWWQIFCFRSPPPPKSLHDGEAETGEIRI